MKTKTVFYCTECGNETPKSVSYTHLAWRDYQKRLDRYALYLHDIRAFNETIRNFIQFSLSLSLIHI